VLNVFATRSLIIMILLLLSGGQVDGDGTILANIIIPNNNHPPLAPLAATPVVGTIFSQTIETHNLSHQIILRIVQYYNQDFDIQPGDTVPIRSQKIANWLRSEI
jgi:hypothetical protein